MLNIDGRIYLTIKEAAEVVGGIEAETLSKYIRQKKLKAYKAFGRWYIDDKELDNYIRTNSNINE